MKIIADGLEKPQNINLYRLIWFSKLVILVYYQVVGSQARILYSNEEGRVKIALAFNQAVADGKLKVFIDTWY